MIDLAKFMPVPLSAGVVTAADGRTPAGGLGLRAPRDGLSNLVTGLGGNNARVAALSYLPSLDVVTLINAYRASGWFRKVVRIPVDDSLSKWRAWQEDKATIGKIEATEKRLRVKHVLRNAFMQSRIFGGAVILPGGLPGNPQEPLDLGAVAPGSVRSLTVLNRYQIGVEGLIKDPNSPWIGGPEWFHIPTDRGNVLNIHPSRVILINGEKAPDTSISADIWGDSIWLHLQDAIQAADASPAVIHALMHEAKVDVVRQSSLMENVASEEYEQLLLRRYQVAASLKSIVNMLLIDKDDEYEQKQINFSGLPAVSEMFLKILAGVSDIPVTRLVGTSASGLNATGEGDLRNYYDAVRARQELEIEPAIAPLDALIQRDSLGRVDLAMWYQWRPLYEPTRAESAAVDKVEAETAKIYAETGLVPLAALETVVQTRMIETGSWPGLEDAIAAAPVEPDDEPEPEEVERTATSDSRPMTLYVRRDVLNKKDIIEWARKNGFASILPDLHVTIMYSEEPVDWVKMGDAWDEDVTIKAGGPRLMETFGEAKVLQIASNSLHYRHMSMREMGAVPTHVEYQPHVTITYGPMPEGVKPFQGKIILGPEIFEEIDSGYRDRVQEQTL